MIIFVFLFEAKNEEISSKFDFFGVCVMRRPGALLGAKGAYSSLFPDEKIVISPSKWGGGLGVPQKFSKPRCPAGQPGLRDFLHF